MITSFEVYLAILIGNLSSVASTLSLICAFAFCIVVFICLKCPEEETEEKKDEEVSKDEKEELSDETVVKWLGIFLIIFSLLAFILPSKKEIAAIYLIPKLANNELVQKMPDYVEPFLKKLLGVEGDMKSK